MNNKPFTINCDLIKYIESTPDTLITLVTGEKIMIRESVENVIEQTMNYRKRLYQEPPAKRET